MAEIDWNKINRDKVLISQGIEQKKSELLNLMYSLGLEFTLKFDSVIQHMRSDPDDTCMYLMAELAQLGSLVCVESIDEDWIPTDIGGNDT